MFLTRGSRASSSHPSFLGSYSACPHAGSPARSALLPHARAAVGATPPRRPPAGRPALLPHACVAGGVSSSPPCARRPVLLPDARAVAGASSSAPCAAQAGPAPPRTRGCWRISSAVRRRPALLPHARAATGASPPRREAAGRSCSVTRPARPPAHLLRVVGLPAGLAP